MLRHGLTIYLMLMTLVGPRLCSCSPPLFVLPTSSPAPRQSDTAFPPRCCCPKHPTGPENTLPSGSQPAPRPHGPCQGRCVAAPALPATRTLAGKLTSVGDPGDALDSAGLFVGFLAQNTDARQSSETSPGLPFLSAWDLLRAFHFLRC